MPATTRSRFLAPIEWISFRDLTMIMHMRIAFLASTAHDYWIYFDLSIILESRCTFRYHAHTAHSLYYSLVSPIARDSSLRISREYCLYSYIHYFHYYLFISSTSDYEVSWPFRFRRALLLYTTPMNVIDFFILRDIDIDNITIRFSTFL
jgi:hypothetical protein